LREFSVSPLILFWAENYFSIFINQQSFNSPNLDWKSSRLYPTPIQYSLLCK